MVKYKRSVKKKLSYHFGNFLMTLSLLILLYIYFPVLALYLNPPKIQASQITQGYNITIPKISAQAPIIENVDPWNPSSYKSALEKGVAQAQNTSLPGQPGTTYLFAHSSDSPWNITRNNTIFLRLDELQNGDKIFLDKDNQRYTYIVSNKKTVNPSDIQYLKDTSKTQLILQTCTPIGTAFKRLLVFAQPT